MDEEMDLQNDAVGELGSVEESIGLSDTVDGRIEVYASEADQFSDAAPVAIIWEDDTEMELSGLSDDQSEESVEETEVTEITLQDLEVLNTNLLDVGFLMVSLVAVLIGFLSAKEFLKIWLP